VEGLGSHPWAFSRTIVDVDPKTGVVYSSKIETFSGKALHFALVVYEEVSMTITVGFDGTTANITLSGNIDYSMQEEIRRANQQALSNEQVKEICVDFAEVTFLDSSVIRALLTLQKEADAARKSLVLLNCNPNTLEVFEIGGFDRMIKFR
jgi:anti-anti-sigma factor